METGVVSDNLFLRARDCLCERSPEVKLQLAGRLREDWEQGRLHIAAMELPDVREAGHPGLPELVHPRQLKRRSLASPEGRLALIHAVTHIEFNAINLACDHLLRFQDMPRDYYRDWIQVVAEEAEHFRLLRDRLRAADCDYGAFPAHNGLWDMAIRSAHDPLVRMALVPRMLEARGLDVTPAMIERFKAAGDRETVTVLSLILQEEVGHVAMGSRWFSYLCRERGLDPEATYFDLLENFLEGRMRCPLHWEARRQAGFSERELTRLEAMCKKS